MVERGKYHEKKFLVCTIFLTLIILVIISLPLASCKNKTESNPTDPTSTNSSDTGETTMPTTNATTSNTGPESKTDSTTTAKATIKNTDSKTTKQATTTNQAEEDIYGKNYSVSGDKFYQKKTIYVTWVNVWHGSTETWFNGLAYSKYGTRIKIDGSSVVPDSNKSTHRKYIFEQAKNAGINALVMDLTNGYNAWSLISKDYQRMCYENNMKFAVATHPKGASDIEEICKFTWDTYVAPGKALYASSYLYKNNKPLMVIYSTKNEYLSATGANGTYKNKFEFVWASGEDSEPDKWGWQLEAQDGPIPSKDSMFITPAISWNSPRSSVDAWRNSMAFLDFGFLAAREINPKFVIVGSVDDTTEHNGWMTMDTSKKTYEMPTISSNNLEIGLSYQIKDIYGKVSPSAYYDRVKQWITNGSVTAFNKNGILADGAYTLTNKASNKKFGVTRPAPQIKPATDLNAVFYRDYMLETKMETYYWFYHLGNNEYKIIKLSSGLALQPNENGRLIQTWDENTDKQRWIITRQSDGSYTIVNKATGKAIHDMANSDDTIYVKPKDGSVNQKWDINPVPGRTIN